MPESVKITKVLDNDTYWVVNVVNNKEQGTPYKLRLAPKEKGARVDAFEHNQPNYSLDKHVQSLQGKVVQIDNLTKDGYNRSLASVTTDKGDLADYLYSQNKIWKSPTGKGRDYKLANENSKDSLIVPNQFKAWERIQEVNQGKPYRGLDINADKYLKQQLFIKYPNLSKEGEMDRFLKRQSDKILNSQEMVQNTQPTQSTVKSKSLAYKDPNKTVSTISVDKGLDLVKLGSINGTNTEDLTRQLSTINPKEISGFELHTVKGVNGDTNYLFPLLKGEAAKNFRSQLASNQDDKLETLGNEYATSSKAKTDWLNQFKVASTKPVSTSVQPITSVINSTSKPLISAKAKNILFSEKDNEISKGMVFQNDLQKQNFINQQKKSINQHEQNSQDSWYLGSGEDRNLSSTDNIVDKATTAGSLVPYLNLLSIPIDNYMSLKREAENGDLELQDAIREIQKNAALLATVGIFKRIGGSKFTKSVFSKSKNVIPKVYNFGKRTVNKGIHFMDKGLPYLGKESKTISSAIAEAFREGLTLKKGGVLKFQNGSQFPSFIQTTYNKSLGNPAPVTYPKVPYSTGFTAYQPNNQGYNPVSKPVYSWKPFSTTAVATVAPVPNTNGLVQPSTDYSKMGNNQFSTISDKPVKTNGNRGFNVGRQELGLALSLLPSLLRKDVRSDKMVYKPLNLNIRPISGDPLQQQRLTAIAQNQLAQSKAVSSDPSNELIHRLVNNRQGDIARQDAYNIDTQARIEDTNRFYGEQNAQIQYNNGNENNIVNQNIQANNNAKTQNALNQQQMISQGIQNTMAYNANKQNDKTLTGQMYLRDKALERQGLTESLMNRHAQESDAFPTEASRQTVDYQNMKARHQKEWDDYLKKNSVDDFYMQNSNGVNITKRGIYNKKGGILFHKKGGSISNATASIIRTKAVDTREYDKAFIATAFKYNELIAKVSSSALDRGTKQIAEAYRSLPKTKQVSFNFKRLN